MMIRQFLLWTQHESAGRRAEAASSLARAYLYADLDPEARWEAKTAVTALLDDSSPLVRRALAEAFANAAEAPRPVVVALAQDVPEIAALVLARSPVLSDADLVDCAAIGEEEARCAVAARPNLSPMVCGALAEIAGVPALRGLAANPGAAITPGSLLRMVERHGEDGGLREALLARPDLPLEVRQAVTARLAQSLSDFVVGCGWLSPDRGERVAREARDRTTLGLAEGAAREDLRRLVTYLRRNGQLTAGLVLRAMLSRRMAFTEAALADLSGLPPARVAGLLLDGSGQGFSALYRRAGLPASLEPAFAAAMSAWREEAQGFTEESGPALSRRMIERAVTACERLPFAESHALVALLNRFEAEAAREEARVLAQSLATEAAVAAVLDSIPAALIESYRQDRLRIAA
ncbi:conserved hypothetical proteinn [Methylobacterium sp. 4-46]|uniref:DUF2336 domain-containing protein n=1 Tax=unclassified Methylobacterium TaxID=2615210 RepID=UPI000165CBAF|nr:MULTISPECIES: DUF2336 domain-containing protein [Methylobacterium]ACA20563.1 conserved hypothetical proteinn [Methylobacterium sp. 4-46]WFT79728.1 DUF2336 domain-containing protein [Methylobacterium nodulans]